MQLFRREKWGAGRFTKYIQPFSTHFSLKKRQKQSFQYYVAQLKSPLLVPIYLLVAIRYVLFIHSKIDHAGDFFL